VLLASRGARGQRPAQLYLAALFAGLLPWAKLQAFAGALVIGGWVIWNVTRKRAPGAVLCFVAPTIALLVLVVTTGAWPDLLASIQGTSAYVGMPSLFSVAHKGRFIFSRGGIHILATGLLTSGWVGRGRPGWATTAPAARSFAWLVGGYAIATLAAVLM